jgi:hypothetical protein
LPFRANFDISCAAAAAVKGVGLAAPGHGARIR